MEEIDLNIVKCEGSGENSDFSVNKKSSCFLCFGREVNFAADNLFKREEVENVSLLSICRYLKINLNQVLTPTSGNVPNICITVCNECSLIVQDLSEFCEELEILQMKVDYALRKFSRVLEHSQEDETLKSIHEHGARRLRQQMVQKCIKRLNASQPRISLSTTDVQQKPRCSSFSFEPEAREYTCPLCSCKFQLESDYLQHTQMDCPFLPPASPSRETSPPPSPTPTPTQLTSTYIKDGKKFSTCTLCTPPRPVPVTNIRRHNIYKHLETFFPSHKLPGVTKPDFKIYCDHVIKVEVLSSEKSQVGPDSNPSCKCSHCPSRYTNSYSLYHHLFSVHQKILSEKLIKLRNTTTPGEIKAVNLPGFAYNQNKRWTCKDCGATFGQDSGWYNHRSRECKFKMVGIKSRKPNCSTKAKGKPEDYYICQLCAKPRRLKKDLKYYHDLQFHVDTILAKDRMPGISMEDFKKCCDSLFQEEMLGAGTGLGQNGKYILKCPYCTSTYTEEKPLRRHMVSLHRAVISEKLANLQQNFGSLHKMDLEKEEEDGPDFQENGEEENCELSFAENAFDELEMDIPDQDDPLQI